MSGLQITIEDAYREACTALGESMVQQRLLGQEIARLQAAQSPEVPTEPPLTN
jgi:hypothetical protein